MIDGREEVPAQSYLRVFVIGAGGVAAWLVLFRFFLTSVSGLSVSDRSSVLPAARGAWRVGMRTLIDEYWVFDGTQASFSLYYSYNGQWSGFIFSAKLWIEITNYSYINS